VILEWLKELDSKGNFKPTDCRTQVGYIQHGFLWAIKLLISDYSYEEALST
jgi:hypothetical protein